jgi:acetyltransferase-like isoleucine patch superfamily enzyme
MENIKPLSKKVKFNDNVIIHHYTYIYTHPFCKLNVKDKILKFLYFTKK